MNEWSQDEILKVIENKGDAFVYFYTPMCGTCQVSSKMLTVVEQLLPTSNFGKANLNFLPLLAKEMEIESVPCLVAIENGQIAEKLYAFHSVPFLYDKLSIRAL